MNHSRYLFSALSFLSALVVVACSDAEEGSSGSSGSGPENGNAEALPCDVDKILSTKCQTCHGASPKFGAPFPLVDRSDLVAPAVSDPNKKVYELVAARARDTARPMPPPPTERLTAAELAVFDQWVAAGMPAGKDTCVDPGGGGTIDPPTLSCTPDVLLAPSAPYVMPKGVQDQYMCYGVDVEIGQKRHLVGVVPHIDNSTIVHHILLFKADEASPSTPTPCNGGDIMGPLLAVWAPGGKATELPLEAGFPLEGTAHFTIQVHYSNIKGLDGQQDSTGFDVCTTTELRPNDAGIFAFGTEDINIPPHGSLDVSCDYQFPRDMGALSVISVMPHMHILGKHLSSNTVPTDGSEPSNLGLADPWNFDNQIWYDNDTILRGGDTVRTRCAWDNPGNSAVEFGDRTLDEMCYNFVMYYPSQELESKVGDWTSPTDDVSCVTTK
ncbi:peptidylglycine alpha-amidating monooxygenase [Sorangium sp. So ce291]|uniref:monooxygenase n=1 Tax=Sorangium sp. So ce291 TaxID=3133294 RepID=UPI003F5DF75F